MAIQELQKQDDQSWHEFAEFLQDQNKKNKRLLHLSHAKLELVRTKLEVLVSQKNVIFAFEIRQILDEVTGP